MSKFHVGDKVRILDGSKIKGYTGGWAVSNAMGPGMDKHIGEVYTVRFVDDNWYDGIAAYRLEGVDFNWDERGLELATEQKIVITTDGKTTFAKLYEGKKVVRVSAAICSPDDKFDFKYGASLALDRLTGSVDQTLEVKSGLDWNKFAHGQLDVKVSKENFDSFMNQCEVNNFIWKDMNGAKSKVNPWQEFEKLDGFAKRFAEAFGFVPGKYIWISFDAKDNSLKWSSEHNEDCDEYEFI